MRRFTLLCSPGIFSDRELEVFHRWGNWMDSLARGSIEPSTEAQERFIRVARGQAEPFTEYEILWWKYNERIKIESDPDHRRAMRSEAREVDRSFGGPRSWHKANAARRGGYFKRVKRK